MVLVVLLLGNSATIPVVILAAVVAFVTAELLPPGPPSRLTRSRPDSPETR